MKIELTEEQVSNTIALIDKSPITGNGALTVALLIETYKKALNGNSTDSNTPSDTSNPVEVGESTPNTNNTTKETKSK